MSEVKLKKITVQGRSTGEIVENVLDAIADGYVFDKDTTFKIGYVQYAEMQLSEQDIKPVKKATKKPKEDKAE